MKKNNKVILVAILVSMQSCCWLFKQDCEPCENIQQGAELADLVLQNFESELEETEDESVVYNIIHSIVNIASDYECPEEVDSSVDHSDKLDLVYSESGDFNDAEIIDTQEASINQNTAPNTNYKVISEIEFLQDGYYQIDNSIDYTNLVPERNEDNNNSHNQLTDKGGTNYDLNNVIHITKAMVKDIRQKQGESKFIRSWKVSVEY